MVKIDFIEELRTLSFNELSLKLVYSKFNISHSYASELFKKEFGKTFRNWRKEKILEETEKYLISSVLDIEQISRSFGYSDIRKFIRFFKKETGFTPDEFRGKYTTDKMAID